MGGRKLRFEIELPVRPAAPRVTESGFKGLKPGESWNFVIPGAGRGGAENFAQAAASLSAMPQLSTSSVARMLASYPLRLLRAVPFPRHGRASRLPR